MTCFRIWLRKMNFPKEALISSIVSSISSNRYGGLDVVWSFDSFLMTLMTPMTLN